MFYSVGEIKRGMVIPGGEYPSDQDKYRTGSGSDRLQPAIQKPFNASAAA